MKLKINESFMPLKTLSYLIISLLFLLPQNSIGKEVNLRESAVVKAVRKVSPAVVNISSEQAVQKRSNPFSGFGNKPFFDSFFKDFFDPGFQRHYKKTNLV